MNPTDHPDTVDHDIAAELCTRVAEADAAGTRLRIAGGGTKAFYGRPVAGTPLDVTAHRGVTHYDPVELVVSVRAGTPLAELERTLAAAGQHLPFEPPHFGTAATVGGMVATGLSGPRRPWSGAVRDFVLGTRLITHRGRELRFGGEVMKNVAGYDLSRLMAGAQGTLGVITEVSMKVLPLPAAAYSLSLALPLEHAMAKLAKWGRQPVPLTAAAWSDGILHLRLEGGSRSVAASRARLGGEDLDPAFWHDLREHRLPFFESTDPRPLWRLSLPHHTPPLALEGDWFLDWGGAQRWLRSDVAAPRIRDAASRAGGHATCCTPGAAEPFHPLAPAIAKYHRQLKAQLDPHGIFNPGRLYPDL
ncbi:Glycolate dehydrogenase, FAD-binding subunit GlcE [Thioalkalivibrio nitratireducens DSM 14787]|uniref:Glycolate dehydrogenase, FAD-binding subunit GlcE n=1 Tax=Thioalkalivibrio nitratireducens (strain DSM 14787 / UNIQEM 213 / ALEN2) TaxID=1255043 RepID=L0DWD9_THIND|nr:glycolate oxidase subunit GlcE [Thioalkalivibrio nitratireducens]AGA33894.1 Glycolate dehydrogenase, FAD-binding subunit GlcE [Thioalkalivibrio nitratireducens DSM 14787]